MQNNGKIMIDVINQAVFGKKKDIVIEDENAFFDFASNHGLLNLPGMIIDSPMLVKAMLKSAAVSEKQKSAADEIFNACEKNGIDILPIKGIVTKNRYENPDFRTMGDIDILYVEKQDELLNSTMLSLGYAYSGRNEKHDHYRKGNFVQVEMHREMAASGSKYFDYYENIWSKVRKKDGFEHIFELSLEDEFIFNIVHLAEHFRSGGVGIRLVMDVYVYNHLSLDFEYLNSELKKIDLTDFYENISLIAEKWFGDNTEKNELTDLMEEFILESGLFGNKENKADSFVGKGRLSFIKKRIFPDLKSMQAYFPQLKKHPNMLFFYWIKRIFIVLIKRRKTLKSQIDVVKSGDPENGKKLNEFYRKCGL